jgi:hypothetical protein
VCWPTTSTKCTATHTSSATRTNDWKCTTIARGGSSTCCQNPRSSPRRERHLFSFVKVLCYPDPMLCIFFETQQKQNNFGFHSLSSPSAANPTAGNGIVDLISNCVSLLLFVRVSRLRVCVLSSAVSWRPTSFQSASDRGSSLAELDTMIQELKPRSDSNAAYACTYHLLIFQQFYSLTLFPRFL